MNNQNNDRYKYPDLYERYQRSQQHFQTLSSQEISALYLLGTAHIEPPQGRETRQDSLRRLSQYPADEPMSAGLDQPECVSPIGCPPRGPLTR